MKIVIDGDSFPYKDAAIDAAGKHNVPVIIVSSVAHFTRRLYPEHVETVLVDSRSQEADIKIMNICAKGDAALTGDTGLSLVLKSKGVTVIDTYGYEPDTAGIEQKLSAAYAVKKALRSKKGRKRVKGPRKHGHGASGRVAAAVEKAIIASKTGG